MASSKKIITVFGATGNQGGSIAKSILSDPKASAEFRIRAVTRDTTKPASKALADKGAELVTVSKPLDSVISPAGLTMGQADLNDE
ncbi:MAG: NmrA family NAD(P)-binding protein, partial [Terriglobus roseus]|nr:NmrA family NAD(P)-binding protein [Terriglobus roseus]